MVRLFGLGVVFALIAFASEAREVAKTIHSQRELELVDSFCFEPSNENHHASIDIKVVSKNPHNDVVVYDSRSWELALAAQTCDAKAALKKFQVSDEDNHLKMLLTDLHQPDYWFVAILCCHTECAASGIEVDLVANLLNPGSSFPSHTFTMQLSAEETGQPVILGIFLVLFAIIGAAHVYGRLIHQQSASLGHQVSHMISIALVIIFFVVVVKFLHFSIYGSTGVGSPTMFAIGDIAELIFEALVIVLSVMVASGWAFGENSLVSGRVKFSSPLITIALYLAVYIGCSVVVLMYRTTAQPKRYLYHHPCGVVTNLLRVGLALSLAYFAKKRLRTHLEHKRRAYGVSITSFTIWLLFLAAMCSLGNYVDFVEHQRFLLLVNLIANFLIVQVLVWLAWPSVATNILSLHASQIDESFSTGRGEDDL